MTTHKHYNEIIAWANGDEIEYFVNPDYGWTLCTKRNPPIWADNIKYRVKPTPKPDKEVSRWVFQDGSTTHSFHPESNVKFTFDGETGKLKAAEVIE